MEMSDSNEPIHLAIAFDEKYLVPFYTLLTSVFYHNKQNTILIHAIATGISEQEKEAIIGYVRENNQDIRFYSIDEQFVSRFVLTSNWTAAVYYRLFFPFLVPPTVNRLLYLDTDTLVVNNLRAFDEIELQGYPVAAAYDNYVKTQPLIGIVEEGNYFNSGVMLINIPQWKQQEISEKAFNYLTVHPERIRFVDQDALNAVLKNNWIKIDNRFNLIYSVIPPGLARQQFNTFLADKIVLHFTLHRPWHMLCQNRFRYLYQYFQRLSPKKNEPTIVDFSARKVKGFVKIRLQEFYFDNPLIMRWWRKIKA
jgi:lipopolysaccharide biosynthesis glycosyltransferase